VTRTRRPDGAQLVYHPGMSAQQVFQRTLPTVRILYGALVASTLLLAFAAFFAKLDIPKEPPAPAMLGMLGAVALALAVASFVLPRTLGATGAKNARDEVLPAEPGYAGTGTPARFADPGAAARKAIAIAQPPFIISMALSEAVSCIGFVSHTLGASAQVSVAFFAAGTTLAALRFPTAGRLVAPFERAHGASFAASMDGGKL
jgi:hypothetical protein